MLTRISSPNHKIDNLIRCHKNTTWKVDTFFIPAVSKPFFRVTEVIPFIPFLNQWFADSNAVPSDSR
ncbi:hypothetical protein S83_012073 [Arachis hypogaea]